MINYSATRQLPLLLASHNRSPAISWLQEAWLGRTNRYEEIATASPRLGVGILGHELLRQHLAILPTLYTSPDILQMLGRTGPRVGSRPKPLTWPLTKKGAARTVERNT